MFLKTIILTLALSLQANASTGASAQQTYDTSTSTEFLLQFTSVNGPMVGAEVFQKYDSFGGFCRKSQAIVPNPRPSYACYSLISNGDDARDLYLNSPVGVLNVSFYRDGSLLLGGHWAEKEVDHARFGAAPILCVERYAIVPNSQVSYGCYSQNPAPIGGAVSVGN